MRSLRGARGLGSGGGEGVTGGTPCKGPLCIQEGPSLPEQWGICQGAWGGGTIGSLNSALVLGRRERPQRTELFLPWDLGYIARPSLLLPG